MFHATEDTHNVIQIEIASNDVAVLSVKQTQNERHGLLIDPHQHLGCHSKLRRDGHGLLRPLHPP